MLIRNDFSGDQVVITWNYLLQDIYDLNNLFTRCEARCSDDEYALDQGQQ